jgi:hypothetical protein
MWAVSCLFTPTLLTCGCNLRLSQHIYLSFSIFHAQERNRNRRNKRVLTVTVLLLKSKEEKKLAVGEFCFRFLWARNFKLELRGE